MLVKDNRIFGICPKCNKGNLKFNVSNKQPTCDKCYFVYPNQGCYGGPRVFYYRRYLKCPKCQKNTFEANGNRNLLLCLVCNHSSATSPCYYCKQNVFGIDNPNSATYDMIGENIQIMHPQCWTKNAKIEGQLTGNRHK